MALLRRKVGVGPVAKRFLAQFASNELACRRSRQALDREEGDGALEAAEVALAGAPDGVEQGSGLQPAAALGDDESDRPFAESRVGHADDGTVPDARRRRDHALDLLRVHVDPAGDDHGHG